MAGKGKGKYQSSDIYTNTGSRQLLKYLYDVLQYENELKEENIIENLIQFRAEIIEEILSNIDLLPENAINHPLFLEKEKLKKDLEKYGVHMISNLDESSAKSKGNSIVGFILVFFMIVFLLMVFINLVKYN